jgi:Domain of unknown function (DUF1824)
MLSRVESRFDRIKPHWREVDLIFLVQTLEMISMIPIESTQLTQSQAIALLHRFTCLEKDPVRTVPNREEIYRALTVVLEASEYQMLGVCAPDFGTGMQALGQYLAALGYDGLPEIAEICGPCYIKYNGKTRSGYVTQYDDGYRGVLIACQSSYDGEVNETFGHFPLDLFNPE